MGKEIVTLANQISQYAAALSAAAFDEELVYRLAIPAVIAAALRLGNVRPNAARIAGLLGAGIWFCLLPGHLDQVSSPAGFVPYVSFAALSAFVVYRSGSILPVAVAHAISNILTFLMFGAAVTAAVGAYLAAHHLETGPMVNIYRVSPAQNPDPSAWVTDVCFPILR